MNNSIKYNSIIIIKVIMIMKTFLEHVIQWLSGGVLINSIVWVTLRVSYKKRELLTTHEHLDVSQGSWLKPYLVMTLVFCVLLCYLLCLSSSYDLCAQCCRYLCIVYSWLPFSNFYLGMSCHLNAKGMLHIDAMTCFLVFYIRHTHFEQLL